LYTRGGDTNSVWPLVSLIREFDPNFEVLVPFRCHSSGTLVALGASKIHMGRLGELSPIDPSTTNAFNPADDKKNLKPISVEDVDAFFELAKDRAGDREDLSNFMQVLASQVHPLALGNVRRVFKQTRQLAKQLILSNGRNQRTEEQVSQIVEHLSREFYSHLHAISRKEAIQILGEGQIECVEDELEGLLDEILRTYEEDFDLRKQYIVNSELGNNISVDVKYIGGIIESADRSYVFSTEGVWQQSTQLPPGVNLNIQPGAQAPLIPGFPRNQNFTLKAQDWRNNGDGV
jgi:hypothetical protein